MSFINTPLGTGDVLNAAQLGVDGSVDANQFRRLYNFGDRIITTAVLESPFFTHLYKYGRWPTNDPEFRVMTEHPVWHNMIFKVDADGGSNASHDVTSTGGFKIGNDNIPIAKALQHAGDGTTTHGVTTVTHVSANGTTTPLYVAGISGDTVTLNTVSGSPIAITAATDEFIVSGSVFGEGSDIPAGFLKPMSTSFGFTQIFKDALHMTGTQMATELKGHKSEWDRNWGDVLRRHKMGLNYTALFGEQGRFDGNMTDGASGIVRHTQGFLPWLKAEDGGTGRYWKTASYDSSSFDTFIDDLGDLFDPTLAGGTAKIAYCGSGVINFFNKLKSNSFAQNSGLTPNGANGYMGIVNIENMKSAMKYSITKLQTIWGTVGLIHEPLFRGNLNNLMVAVDHSKAFWRPLIGNGQNRDTFIQPNAEVGNRDMRSGFVMTEGGFHFTNPECHMVWQFS